MSKVDSLKLNPYGLWNRFWRMKPLAEKRGILFQVPSAGWTEAGEHLIHNFHTSKELFRHDKTSLIFPIDAVSLIQKASSQLSLIRVTPTFLRTLKSSHSKKSGKRFWFFFVPLTMKVLFVSFTLSLFQ